MIFITYSELDKTFYEDVKCRETTMPQSRRNSQIWDLTPILSRASVHRKIVQKRIKATVWSDNMAQISCWKNEKQKNQLDIWNACLYLNFKKMMNEVCLLYTIIIVKLLFSKSQKNIFITNKMTLAYSVTQFCTEIRQNFIQK